MISFDPCHNILVAYSTAVSEPLGGNVHHPLFQLLTEGLFSVRYDWTVRLMSDQTPVFAYEFHYRGENGFTNNFVDNLPQAAKCRL